MYTYIGIALQLHRHFVGCYTMNEWINGSCDRSVFLLVNQLIWANPHQKAPSRGWLTMPVAKCTGEEKPDSLGISTASSVCLRVHQRLMSSSGCACVLQAHFWDSSISSPIVLSSTVIKRSCIPFDKNIQSMFREPGGMHQLWFTTVWRVLVRNGTLHEEQISYIHLGFYIECDTSLSSSFLRLRYWAHPENYTVVFFYGSKLTKCPFIWWTS